MPRCAWTGFHRLDKAGVKACRDSDLACAFTNLLKDLEACFGGGQGRQLDQQVSSMLGIKFLVGRKPGSTRKFVYFSGGPAIYLKKFPAYYRAIELRRNHSLEGRTNKTPQWWTELGHRFASARLLTFIMCFQQILESARPFALSVQATNSTPWSLQSGFRMLKENLGQQLEQLRWLERVLQVMQFVQPYVATESVRFFLDAISLRFCRASNILSVALPVLWTQGRFCGMNVLLDYSPTEPNDPNICLHNACQCLFRKGPPLPSAGSGSGASAGQPTAVRVEWSKWGHILQQRKTHGQSRTRRLKDASATVLMAAWVRPCSPLCHQDVFKVSRQPHSFGHTASRGALRQQPPHRGCVVNKFAAHAAQEVLGGISGACDFIVSFLHHLDGRTEFLFITYFLAFLLHAIYCEIALPGSRKSPGAMTMPMTLEQQAHVFKLVFQHLPLLLGSCASFVFLRPRKSWGCLKCACVCFRRELCAVSTPELPEATSAIGLESAESESGSFDDPFCPINFCGAFTP